MSLDELIKIDPVMNFKNHNFYLIAFKTIFNYTNTIECRSWLRGGQFVLYLCMTIRKISRGYN